MRIIFLLLNQVKNKINKRTIFELKERKIRKLTSDIKQLYRALVQRRQIIDTVNL